LYNQSNPANGISLINREIASSTVTVAIFAFRYNRSDPGAFRKIVRLEKAMQLLKTDLI
jgi:hypothetical protein